MQISNPIFRKQIPGTNRDVLPVEEAPKKSFGSFLDRAREQQPAEARPAESAAAKPALTNPSDVAQNAEAARKDHHAYLERQRVMASFRSIR
ncbi:MAG: hypothetical protein HY013_12720 [Candidatus Solibacter usitatus]|nr:hypothetical protein [Candidatus Solibacter usitatus]